MEDLCAQSEQPPAVFVKTDLKALLCEAQRRMDRYLGDPEQQSLSPSDIVKIQAPMVRCSRPPFRKLCRLWGTDVSYTHMIMADSFARSHDARVCEFALYSGEDRLVAQIAAKSGPTAAAAAELMAPYCDAIDLNCGCPQKWAMKEGVGSALLESPQLVADMVSCVRNTSAAIPCVVKMRVNDDPRRSVDFARQVESAGASWITIHGRTPQDLPNAPVRHDVIRLIRESVEVPVVANGAVECLDDAVSTAVKSTVGSVMSARGLLANPAAFYCPAPSERLTFGCGEAGFCEPMLPSELPDANKCLCPVEVISDFVRLAAVCDLPLKATSHHVMLMTERYLSPAERLHVSQLRSNAAMAEALRSLGLLIDRGKFALPPY
jgi:tRNA-dihydrouridine synthase